MLPEWWSEPPVLRASRRRRSRWLPRRGLAEMGRMLSQLLSPARPGDSFLARLDPRSKLIGFGLLIVATSLLQSLTVLTVVLAAVLAAFLFSRVSIRRLAPMLLWVPLFTGAIVLPAALNVVTPGPLILKLWSPGDQVRLAGWLLPAEIGFSAPGLFLAARFLLRTSACVSLAVLLTATTGQTQLLGGLRRLGMPKVFGMVLTMMHRYLVLLINSAAELHEARTSRPAGSAGLRSGYLFAAAGIGIIFRRAWRLGEEVYQAMLSRGYDGEVRVIAQAGFAARDWAWIAGCLALVLVSRMVVAGW